MTTAVPFKICSMCKTSWDSREQFLNDATLDLNGYMADPNIPENGLFYFTHKRTDCFSTLAIQTSQFLDLHTGKKYDELKYNTDECQGHCFSKNDLSPCNANCSCAYIREIIQILQAKKDNQQ